MPQPSVAIGDPIPAFTQIADFPAQRFTFDMQGGTHLLLLFGLPEAPLADIVQSLPSGRWHVLHVTTAKPPSPLTPGATPRLNTIFDEGSTVHALFGIAPNAGPVYVAISPAQRVTAIGSFSADQLAALCAETARQAASRPGTSPAPILHLPDVLEPDLCRALIAYYQTHDPQPSKVMTTDRAGKPIHVLAPGYKMRHDCLLQDRTLVAAVQGRIVRRVVPEIFKAFRFRATQMDRMLLSAYDAADRGFFAAHRDNTIAASAHRQFAVSLTLNDAFSGGGLNFPEFNDDTHRAEAGGAIVFSCALMHAVAPVTEGRRYAFLPFVY